MIHENITEQEARELIESELVRMADGDERKLWRLRKIQNRIDKQLRNIKDPIARMVRMKAILLEFIFDHY